VIFLFLFSFSRFFKIRIFYGKDLWGKEGISVFIKCIVLSFNLSLYFYMFRFGRKRAILIATICFVGCSVGVAFSPSYEAFVITRLLAGAFHIIQFIAVFTYGIFASWSMACMVG